MIYSFNLMIAVYIYIYIKDITMFNYKIFSHEIILLVISYAVFNKTSIKISIIHIKNR